MLARSRPHFTISDFIDDARRNGAQITSADTNLILALAEQQRNDPKHLINAIRGGKDWFWSEDMSAEDLWSDAEARVSDLLFTAKEDGLPTNSVPILSAIAANWTAYCLIDVQRDRARAYEADWDDRGTINYGRLYA